MLSPRFSHTPNLQYYAPLPSIDYLLPHLSALICPPASTGATVCNQDLIQLATACSLDLSYDAISSSLIVSSYHAPQAWSETLPSSDVEIGILSTAANPTDKSHELTLSGLLTTPPDTPQRTRFSFPSRHHKVPSTFRTSFDQPTGLHPTLRLTFSDTPSAPQPSCKLHIALTLPSPLFLDRYAFRDSLFLSSHNLTALHSISGATDLEAPEWLVPQWGSSALFEVAEGVRGATVPLHLRYLKPADGGYRNATVGVPQVFWACHAEEGTKFGVNPFDRKGVGEGSFGERTGFWWLSPEGNGPEGGIGEETGAESGSGRESGLMMNVSVPVLDTSAVTAPWIDSVTMAVVTMGFAWIVWRLVRHIRASEMEVESRKER